MKDKNEMSDRLASAMALRGRDVRYLVESTGLSKSGIHFVLNGTTRAETVRAVNVDLLADALNVRRDWLLYGRGLPERDEIVKDCHPSAGSVSHIEAISPAILARSEFWLRVEERAGVEYPDMRRAERMIALYKMIEADGGDLSPEHTVELVLKTQGGNKDERGHKRGRLKQ